MFMKPSIQEHGTTEGHEVMSREIGTLKYKTLHIPTEIDSVSQKLCEFQAS